jgi:hypothetical protein
VGLRPAGTGPVDAPCPGIAGEGQHPSLTVVPPGQAGASESKEKRRSELPQTPSLPQHSRAVPHKEPHSRVCGDTGDQCCCWRIRRACRQHAIAVSDQGAFTTAQQRWTIFGTITSCAPVTQDVVSLRASSPRSLNDTITCLTNSTPYDMIVLLSETLSHIMRQPATPVA